MVKIWLFHLKIMLSMVQNGKLLVSILIFYYVLLSFIRLKKICKSSSWDMTKMVKIFFFDPKIMLNKGQNWKLLVSVLIFYGLLLSCRYLRKLQKRFSRYDWNGENFIFWAKNYSKYGSKLKTPGIKLNILWSITIMQKT